MYQRLLVPVDDSDTALEGLDEAVRLAKTDSSVVRLVHVLHQFERAPGHAAHGSFSSVRDKMRGDGDALLSRCSERARQAGVVVETALLASITVGLADQIAEEALRWQADLIVVGTHGRKGIERILWGSEAQHLMQRTSVPVLLVQAPA